MEKELIDLASARSFLRNHLGTDISDLQEVGKGEWSTAYAYRTTEI